MDYEILFSNIGRLACIVASIYMLISGQRKAALLFLLSFILQFQSALYIEFIDHPEGTGECWATAQEYYACLPLSFKLSIHSAQAGVFVMALAIVVLAKQNMVRE